MKCNLFLSWCHTFHCCGFKILIEKVLIIMILKEI